MTRNKYMILESHKWFCVYRMSIWGGYLIKGCHTCEDAMNEIRKDNGDNKVFKLEWRVE